MADLAAAPEKPAAKPVADGPPPGQVPNKPDIPSLAIIEAAEPEGASATCEFMVDLPVTPRVEDRRHMQLFMTILAEQCGRYDDMFMAVCGLLKICTEHHLELTTTERSLLAQAFKKAVEKRRLAWANCVTEEQLQKDAKIEQFAKVAEKLKLRVEKEVLDNCAKVELLLSKYLKVIPAANIKSKELRPALFKIRADAARYSCQIASDKAASTPENSPQAAIERVDALYREAMAECAQDIPSSHPLALSLQLNFAVFVQDIERDCPKAIQILEKLVEAGHSGYVGTSLVTPGSVATAGAESNKLVWLDKDVKQIVEMAKHNLANWK